MERFDLQRLVKAAYCFLRKNKSYSHEVAIKQSIQQVAGLFLGILLGFIFLLGVFYNVVILGGVERKRSFIDMFLVLIIGFTVYFLISRFIKRRITLDHIGAFYEDSNIEVIKKEREYYYKWTALITCISVSGIIGAYLIVYFF